ncbi:MAG: hypothetical protein HPY50_10610 [Firmicutes bacterium]|nr:hypothetical protein [Bacillota bacterium]
MGALYDTDASSLFPTLFPPAAKKDPAEAVQPEVSWLGRFWTWFSNLSLFDPGALIIILVLLIFWLIYWWILFK